MEGDDGQWGMTDLEERLRGREGAALRAELLSRLSHVSGRLGVMVAEGLHPDDFERASAMRAAVDSARSLLASLS